jgi:hypothetical protein
MERYAITGYVADPVASRLKATTPGTIEIAPERGHREVCMRVDGADVDEVRTGTSAHGETLVQLILRDGAVVETLFRTTADVKGVARFNDPTLARLTASATVKVIEA